MLSPKMFVKGFCAIVAGTVILACVNSSGSGTRPMAIPVSAAPQDEVRNIPTSTAAQDAEVESGHVAQAEPGLIEGFTEPYHDINVAASEMGTLESVLVSDGERVKRGQLLAKLNDDVLTASLKVAEAGMNACGELRTAETQLELKKVELQKLTELFEREHASQQELDLVAGELSVAESRVITVREDLEVRRLECARIEAQLQQREIRSTIDGIIVEVRKDEGEFVSPSDPVVARLVQLDPLRVVFSVPNDRRPFVRLAQEVTMQIAGGGLASGVIEHISPTADASSGTFQVNVTLSNSQGRWYGGEKSILMLAERAYEKRERLAKRTK